jgi:hypothetical protein
MLVHHQSCWIGITMLAVWPSIDRDLLAGAHSTCSLATLPRAIMLELAIKVRRDRPRRPRLASMSARSSTPHVGFGRREGPLVSSTELISPLADQCRAAAKEVAGLRGNLAQMHTRRVLGGA